MPVIPSYLYSCPVIPSHPDNPQSSLVIPVFPGHFGHAKLSLIISVIPSYPSYP